MDGTDGDRYKGDGLGPPTICLIYAVCHVICMSSACANPVIYGFLNENFNKEFKAGVNTLTGQNCVSIKRDDMQFAIKIGLFL